MNPETASSPLFRDKGVKISLGTYFTAILKSCPKVFAPLPSIRGIGFLSFFFAPVTLTEISSPEEPTLTLKRACKILAHPTVSQKPDVRAGATAIKGSLK